MLCNCVLRLVSFCVLRLTCLYEQVLQPFFSIALIDLILLIFTVLRLILTSLYSFLVSIFWSSSWVQFYWQHQITYQEFGQLYQHAGLLTVIVHFKHGSFSIAVWLLFLSFHLESLLIWSRELYSVWMRFWSLIYSFSRLLILSINFDSSLSLLSFHHWSQLLTKLLSFETCDVI